MRCSAEISRTSCRLSRLVVSNHTGYRRGRGGGGRVRFSIALPVPAQQPCRRTTPAQRQHGCQIPTYELSGTGLSTRTFISNPKTQSKTTPRTPRSPNEPSLQLSPGNSAGLQRHPAATGPRHGLDLTRPGKIPLFSGARPSAVLSCPGPGPPAQMCPPEGSPRAMGEAGSSRRTDGQTGRSAFCPGFLQSVKPPTDRKVLSCFPHSGKQKPTKF